MKPILVEPRPSVAVKVDNLKNDAIIGYIGIDSFMLSVIVDDNYIFFNTGHLNYTVKTEEKTASAAIKELHRRYSGAITEWFVFEDSAEAIRYAAKYLPKA